MAAGAATPSAPTTRAALLTDTAMPLSSDNLPEPLRAFLDALTSGTLTNAPPGEASAPSSAAAAGKQQDANGSSGANGGSGSGSGAGVAAGEGGAGSAAGSELPPALPLQALGEPVITTDEEGGVTAHMFLVGSGTPADAARRLMGSLDAVEKQLEKAAQQGGGCGVFG